MSGKIKKLLALVGIIVLVCSACQTPQSENMRIETQNADKLNSDSAEGDGSDKVSNGATEGKAEENEDIAEEDEDIAEIEIMFWTLAGLPRDTASVEEAINKITREKIHTEIHLNILESGNYVQQVNLMMAGDEKIDLMVTLPGGSAHFNSMTAQNQLTDLTELFSEYAPELLKTVPEKWMAATAIDGKYYAVPSFGDKVTPLYFVCRKDILEQTGISKEQIKSMNDLELLLSKAKELAPDLAPVAAARRVLGIPYFVDKDGNLVKYDGLGDGDNAIIGIMDKDGTTIVNNYEREEFTYTCELFRDWYDKGYIYKDCLNYNDVARQQVADNVAFGYFGTISTGAEVTESVFCNHEMEFILLDGNPLLTTSDLRRFTWAVPATSTEKEAAVKFLNLLYTDEEILNLMTWGIEGSHYRTMEDGSIDFIEGQDRDSCSYYIGDITPILGNGFLAKVRSGQAPDLRDQAKTLNLDANISQFVGFTFSADGLENEIAAMTNAVEEYRPSLICGAYTEDYYNEFMKKMTDVGVDRYISEIQKQLDDFLEAGK